MTDSLFGRRPTGAGRAALRAYRDLPAAARVHATVRWWSAPFPRDRGRACRSPAGCWRSGAVTGCSAPMPPWRYRHARWSGWTSTPTRSTWPGGSPRACPGSDLAFRGGRIRCRSGGTVGCDRRSSTCCICCRADEQRSCWPQAAAAARAGRAAAGQGDEPDAAVEGALEHGAGDAGRVRCWASRSGTARVHPISTSSTRTRWRPGCATTACGPLSSGWTGTGCTRTTWSSVGSARIRRHDQDRHDQDRHDQDQS